MLRERDHTLKGMSTDTLLAKALELSPEERILLIEEIWDSLADEADQMPLTEDQKA